MKHKFEDKIALNKIDLFSVSESAYFASKIEGDYKSRQYRVGFCSKVTKKMVSHKRCSHDYIGQDVKKE